LYLTWIETLIRNRRLIRGRLLVGSKTVVELVSDRLCLRFMDGGFACAAQLAQERRVIFQRRQRAERIVLPKLFFQNLQCPNDERLGFVVTSLLFVERREALQLAYRVEMVYA